MTTQTAVPLNLPANYQKAIRVREAKEFIFPDIPGWSTKPEHALRKFQRVGIGWMYFAQRGILGDQTGLGKTIQTLGVVQFLASRGEPHRTILICPKGAQDQWYREVLTFTDLVPAMARGNRLERAAAYSNSRWDIMVTTYPLLLRDYKILRSLVENGRIGVVAYDEASVFRHHETQTAMLAKQLVRGVPRIYALDATPVQNSLLDIHSICEVLHMNIFGPLPAFEREFVRREPVKVRRGNTFVSQSRIVGYRNMGKFKTRIGPFILRRRKREVATDLPTMQVTSRWFELPKAQQDRYNQVRSGLVELMQAGERLRLRASFCHLQYACDTTAAFGDDPSVSVKLDWLLEKLTGDLVEDQVIIFSQYKNVIRDLVGRIEEFNRGLRQTGSEEDVQPITYGVITGDTPDEERASIKSGLWSGRVRVIIGTAAIAKSLNFQQAAYLIAINQMWNPRAMEQLAGRIDRIGSPHANIFMINLLTIGTIEEKLQRLLQERNAIGDFVLDEKSDLFASLSDEALADLIRE